MRQICMESDDPYEVIDILFTFMDDVYKYLGIELPEYFDPDEELVNIVQAIMDKKNALQKS
jgi:hypothetical protein